jgi:hypothetical protein
LLEGSREVRETLGLRLPFKKIKVFILPRKKSKKWSAYLNAVPYNLKNMA